MSNTNGGTVVTVEFNGERRTMTVDRVETRFGADRAFVSLACIVRYATGTRTHVNLVHAYLCDGVFVVPSHVQESRGRGRRTVQVVALRGDAPVTTEGNW